MARSLSQTLTRISNPTFLSAKSQPPPHSSRLLSLRNRSNQSEKSQLIEIDIDSDTDLEVLGLRRIEDAIHGIIVKRSAPDWMPFIPGSSYWVPPRKRSYGIAELVGKFAAAQLTEEESMSLTTVRGWPSLAYFVKGASPHPAEVERTSQYTPQSEDEEG